MRLMLSGEGPSDIGKPNTWDSNQPQGPMTTIIRYFIDKEVEDGIPADKIIIVDKSHLETTAAKKRKSQKYPGVKRSKGTLYYERNAEALACLALSESERECVPVIAVLFRDSDGTQKTPSNEWKLKYDSMVRGFKNLNFSTGVPMIPCPKSEAWLICALKQHPYQSCEHLEKRSGNDASPKSLKSELERLLMQNFPPKKKSNHIEMLDILLNEGKIDLDRINMPSFNAFKQALSEAITAAQRPSTTI